jgi:subtilase family serine protease
MGSGLVNWKPFALVLAVALAGTAFAQGPAAPLVTQPIDESQRFSLRGTVHPLAQARYDQGAVPDSFPAARILLLLNRPPEREAALQEFLRDVQRPGSPAYHQWLTPQEFGDRFGAADSDVQAASAWLTAHGFRVARVAQSKQFMEFSGTAGQLRSAFQTQVHSYLVNGQTHYANAGEISIPSALAALVRGVSPLNNFLAEPYVRVAGTGTYSPSTKKATPDWTIANPFGTPNPFAFLVAPEDLATQYDIKPLYQAGIDGTGQTIGIINESNIDISLAAAYEQIFGLPANPPQVVLDGGDPGTNGAETEAYLDVEVSGAIAPKSTVNLYIAEGSDLQDPLELAAIRAVEDDQASVLSISFGSCEVELGNAGNLFWSSLWAEAAAQGQTVLVSSGDSGPTCNEIFPNAVSGIASTPWNIAVGGTDFYYSDYATGGASATTLWNQTNDSSLGSLIAPLPEQPWDDGFGLNVISNGLERGEIGAGGGGPSNCATVSTAQNGSTCLSGYSKPSWQAGPGVASDGVRDIPDVALYASNGANLSAYPICDFEGACAAGTGVGDDVDVGFVGGTSASAPLMAGIMALIDQKCGRQGQADFTLYALAQQKPAAFHDITVGSNSFICNTPEADCSADGETTVYSAGPGYDMASGLGSLDVNILLNDWTSLSFKSTATTLSLSSSKIEHGKPVTVTTSVAPSSGSGTPAGNVAILTTSPLPASQSQTFISLAGGTGTASVDYFPGGYYDVTADYSGDGVFGSSTSSPVALTVIPENSNINFSLLNGTTSIGQNGSVPYNAPFLFSIQPIGVNAPVGSADGNATGSATFTVDSTSAAVPLNSVGTAAWTPPALSPGTHTASATYSGDASFNASSAAPVSFSVTKGTAFLSFSINAPAPINAHNFVINPGGSITLVAQVGPNGGPEFGTVTPLGTAAPTGTVEICLGGLNIAAACLNPAYSQTATLASPGGINAQDSNASVTFTNLAAGFYTASFSYSGDSNWLSAGEVINSPIEVTAPTAQAASTTTLTVTPSAISGTQGATISTTVTGSGSTGAPTGLVEFFDNGIFLDYDILPPASGLSSSVRFSLDASAFSSGPNSITAVYQGDSNYQSSTSNAVTLTVAQNVGDFSLVPQSPQISVEAGASQNVAVNLTSINGFAGVVNLSCASSSSSVTCNLRPSAPTVNGATTAMLTITSTEAAAALPVGGPGSSAPFARASLTREGSFLLALLVLAGVALLSLHNQMRNRLSLPGSADRHLRRADSLAVLGAGALCIALFFVASCGGGSPSQTQTPPPPPVTTTASSVVVTGTANGVIHNAKITVLVP